MIHSTAVIHSGARIGPGCEIGPYAIVGDNVEIGAGCRIYPHVVIHPGSVLDEAVIVHPGAVIGGEPQSIGFDPSTPSGVRVGSGSIIREGVTISRSMYKGGETLVGERCFLMACAHVAHDCRLGERVILANAALLAGHVEVGRFSFLGGGCGIHQFTRIGEGVMVGGNSSISMDVPPFCTIAERDRLTGLNTVGLSRRGMGAEVVSDLKRCFHAVYDGGGNPRTHAAESLAGGFAQTEQGRLFLGFFIDGKRGIARPRGVGARE